MTEESAFFLVEEVSEKRRWDMPAKGPFPVRGCTKVFESWDGKYLFAELVFFAPALTVNVRRKKVFDPDKKQTEEKRIVIVKCSVKKLSQEERKRIFGEARYVFDKEDQRREYEEVCPSLPGMEPPSFSKRRKLIAEEEKKAPTMRVDHKRPPF